jgi:hypothetical protein
VSLEDRECLTRSARPSRGKECCDFDVSDRAPIVLIGASLIDDHRRGTLVSRHPLRRTPAIRLVAIAFTRPFESAGKAMPADVAAEVGGQSRTRRSTRRVPAPA